MDEFNMRAWKFYEFTVPAAGSAANIAISPAVAAGRRLEVKQIYVAVDSATSTAGGVSVRIGFAAATLTAVSSVESTPVAGMLVSHPGIAAGSGLYGIPGIGADGEELRATVQTPTDGSVAIVFMARDVPA